MCCLSDCSFDFVPPSQTDEIEANDEIEYYAEETSSGWMPPLGNTSALTASERFTTTTIFCYKRCDMLFLQQNQELHSGRICFIPICRRTPCPPWNCCAVHSAPITTSFPAGLKATLPLGPMSMSIPRLWGMVRLSFGSRRVSRFLVDLQFFCHI